MQKIGIAILFIILFAFTMSANAQNTQALLVLDMQNTNKLPNHFRTTSDPLQQKNNINLTGFSDLHLVGSGQFSETALQNILQRFDKRDFLIIDLRQESHGFLNDNAISWYAPQNAENEGKTSRQIESDQNKHLASLHKSSDVTVHKILKKTDDEIISKTEPLTFHVEDLLTEAELAEKLHVKYERVYVQDFHAPDAKEIDHFIRLVKTLPRDQWIYFHCRGGVGRTSTFMVMFDMMRNAKFVSLEDILARQTAIGGKDLTEMPSPNKYKYKYAIERLEFLKKFYEYARDNNDHYETTWSEYLRVSNKK